jgi:hypothetical protein
MEAKDAMSDSQEYYDWKENVDTALCILQEKILCLEKKVKLLEKNTACDASGKLLKEMK